jgi:hypothetical protein
LWTTRRSSICSWLRCRDARIPARRGVSSPPGGGGGPPQGGPSTAQHQTQRPEAARLRGRHGRGFARVPNPQTRIRLPEYQHCRECKRLDRPGIGPSLLMYASGALGTL